jgi:hypothetical protein
MPAELTSFTKADGPLTKCISLAPDGTVKSDGSACIMARGAAQRLRIADVGELAAVIEKIRPEQAIALGALRAGLPEKVLIAPKNKLNGQTDTIARTAAEIVFQKEKPALALLDYDTKGIPGDVLAEIKRRGGFWPTLLSVSPPLRSVAHLIRRSTSAGLFRFDTGEKIAGSDGEHIYILVQDGGDVGRYLRDLHARCWLAGFGWLMVGAGGQLLDRSIVDRTVGGPERLVFEGGPILDPPLCQDRESRRPIPFDGAALDTIATCSPLTIVQTAKLNSLKAKEKYRLKSHSAKARATFVAIKAKSLADRTGMSEQVAAEAIARQCDGVLLPEIELPFDDDDFAGCTVGDVLADPNRFEGATLADPLEGVQYGTCKARIMVHTDGTPWIHSFAHGRTIYSLKHNSSTVRAAIEKANDGEIVKNFLKLALAADLSKPETEALRNEVAKRSKLNKRTISDMLKAAQQEHAAKQKQQALEQGIAERADPRPTINAPSKDAPWLPTMGALNEVIGASTVAHPPARDIDGVAAFTSHIAVPNTHAFTPAEANPEEDGHDEPADPTTMGDPPNERTGTRRDD